MKFLIKYILILALATGLGLLAGWGYQKYESTTIDENFFSDQWGESSGNTKSPIVTVVGSTRVDMGKLSNEEVNKHEFIFKNDGTELLEIWVDRPSPKHFGLDLSTVKADIPVGKTKVVTVFISAKAAETVGDDGQVYGEFMIRTTDPSTPRIVLQVGGTMEKKEPADNE